MIKINLIEKLKTTLFTRTVFYWQAVLVIQFKNCPNLGDCIVLLRGGFIISQESEQSCICVLRVSIFPLLL